MSQFTPPQPPNLQPGYAPPTATNFITAPKWSIAAIIGFILAFLGPLAPIGVIVGIIGIVRCSGRKRKGMGLSIAAIPVGVVVSVITVLLGFSAYYGLAALKLGHDGTDFLRSSRATIVADTGVPYEKCSDRFRVAVSLAEFQDWAVAVVDKHGQLQEIRPAQPPIEATPDGAIRLNLIGEFVNGPASVKITVGFDSGGAAIDNFEVDGVSAMD